MRVPIPLELLLLLLRARLECARLVAPVAHHPKVPLLRFVPRLHLGEQGETRRAQEQRLRLLLRGGVVIGRGRCRRLGAVEQRLKLRSLELEPRRLSSRRVALGVREAKGAALRRLAVEARRALGHAGEGRMVHVHEPRACLTPLRPLELIDERVGKVAPHIDAVAHRTSELAEVELQIAHARGITLRGLGLGLPRRQTVRSDHDAALWLIPRLYPLGELVHSKRRDVFP